MTTNLANQLGRLTPDQLATVTFEAGFDSGLGFSPASYAGFVANNYNINNPGSPSISPEVDTIQNALQTGGTVSIGFYNQVPADAFSTAEEDNALQALAIWTGMANINFQVVPAVNASFVFVHAGDTIGADTAAVPSGTYFVARQTIGTATPNLFRTNTGYVALDNKTTNSDGSLAYGDFTSLTNEAGYGFDVLVHEVGHLVGLGHTGPYNFNTDPALNVPAGPNQNNATDVRSWSIMSYIDPNGTGTSDTGTYAAGYDPVVNWGTDPVSHFLRTPLTPMGLDVIAAQRLLGAPTSTTFGGHDIFGFNSNITYTDSNGNQTSLAPYNFTLDPTPIITIYDYGLDNTLDLSGFSTPSTVNLTDGSWSSVAGLTDNIFIEWGTKIDSAVGGTGDDSFTVNFDGDTIDGGGGTNTVVLTDRRADYAYDVSGGTIILADTKPGHVGTNRLSNISSFVFSDVTLAAGALSSIKWTGAVGNDFGIAGNWDINQVPSSQSDVTINGTAGTSVQVVQQSTNSFDSLFLGTGNSLDITTGQFGFSGANRASAILGTLAVDSGAIAYFNGNLDNFGTVVVGGAFLADGPTIAVGGGGTIALQNGNIGAFEDANGTPLQYDAFDNADNTIEGYGVIGSSGFSFPIRFLNEGLVLADQPLPLTLKGATTNTGTLADGGIGTLDLQGEVVNTGGTVLAQGTLGKALLDGVLLHGGRLYGTSGGTIDGTGAVTLDSTSAGVTLDTDLTLQSGSGLTLLGRMTGSGTINAAGSGLFLSGPHALGVPVTGNPTITYIGNGPTIYGTSPLGTIDPTLTIAPDKSVTFASTPSGNGFIENATLDLAGTPSAGATLFIDDMAALYGGGTIALAGPADAIAGVERLGSPDWLFLESATISGVGEVGANSLAIDTYADGTIMASGGTMYLDPADTGGQMNRGGTTNRGWVGAAPGATLAIMGTLDNQQGGTLGATGTIALGGTIDGLARAGAIVAGTLPVGGLIEGSGTGGTLYSVTNQGTIAVDPDQTLSLAQTMYNAATIAVSGSFDAANTIAHAAELLIPGDVSLTSGGTVSLAGSYASITGAGTLENIDNVIAGQGTLGGGGLQFVNYASAVVDGTLAGLVVDGTSGGEFNYGTLEATGGGTLALRGTIVNGSDVFASPVFIGGGGTVAASGANSVVRLDNAVLRNGVLSSDTGGAVDVVGSSTLASDSQFQPGAYDPTYGAENLADLRVGAGATLTSVNGLGNAGTIELASGSTLAASGSGAALAGHGTVTLAGTARLMAASIGDTLQNNDNLIRGAGFIGAGAAGISNYGGTIVAAGGTLAIDLGAGTRFVNYGGTLGTSGGVLVVAQGLTNNGWMDAAGGSIDIGGTLDGSGYVTLEAGSTVRLGGPVSFGQSFSYAGGGATLDIADPAEMSGSLDGMVTGDTIRVEGVVADSTFFTGSALELLNGGTTVASVPMFGNYSAATFNLASDNAAGTLVTLACFATGTRIRTPAGEVPVEALRAGDLVVSVFGGSVPVVWLGHRHVEVRRHPRPHDVAPIRVHAHAFGPGRPRQDLCLSPDHAVYVDGCLIPVRYLVNGATIVRELVDSVTYWHVELPVHDVVLAEGLACESYLDTGNRSAFANGGPVVQAHPDFSRGVWETSGCAPLVVDGAALVAARSETLAAAEALGHHLSGDPRLRVTADRAGIEVRREGPKVAVTLPPNTDRLRLRSRRWIPAHTRPFESDDRQLGVAISGLSFDGGSVALDDARLSSGWHAPERDWRWTDGDAGIAVAGIRRISFTVAMTGTYWAARSAGRSARRA